MARGGGDSVIRPWGDHFDLFIFFFFFWVFKKRSPDVHYARYDSCTSAAPSNESIMEVPKTIPRRRHLAADSYAVVIVVAG